MQHTPNLQVHFRIELCSYEMMTYSRKFLSAFCVVVLVVRKAAFKHFQGRTAWNPASINAIGPLADSTPSFKATGHLHQTMATLHRLH